jgi:hypothetical protein
MTEVTVIFSRTDYHGAQNLTMVLRAPKATGRIALIRNDRAEWHPVRAYLADYRARKQFIWDPEAGAWELESSIGRTMEEEWASA